MKSTSGSRLWRAGVFLAWLPIATAASAEEAPSSPSNASTTPAAAGASPRVDIVGDTLVIQGTPADDRILIKAARRPDTVRVVFDGRHLGHYGPVARIAVHAGDGDDTVDVSRKVALAARLNGGAGDDRLRGGGGADLVFGEDGDDVLFATRGRDALDGGPGNNRLVVRRMGELHVGSAAAGDALRLLAKVYKLRPLGKDRDGGDASVPVSGPIVVGPADLSDDAVVERLRASYRAGHTIALASAAAADAELLRSLLGHASGATWHPDIPQADLIALRRSIRPDGRRHESTSVLLPRLAVDLPRAEARRGGRAADSLAVEWLSGVFSGTPVLVDAGDSCAATPEQCLLNLANSYQSKIVAVNAHGLQVQIVNSVWDARSFQNQEDLYYVLQEIDYSGPAGGLFFPSWLNNASNSLLEPDAPPTTIQPSPQTTQESTTVTSGVDQSYGGNIGYNAAMGLNATTSAGVTIENSRSVTVPPVVVNYEGNLATGETAWRKLVRFDGSETNTTITFFNQWIWEVPFADYDTAQQNVEFASAATLNPILAAALTADLLSVVPLPFGDVFALEQPVVTSVDPTTVFGGDEFTITGTGLYPALVTGVSIDGEPLDPTQFSTVSDTEITVDAPDLLGCCLPVVVQTTQGISNDTVTIAIISVTES